MTLQDIQKKLKGTRYQIKTFNDQYALLDTDGNWYTPYCDLATLSIYVNQRV